MHLRILVQPVLHAWLAQGGLFHCTSMPALRRILHDGRLRPAVDTGAPAHGAAVASRARRLGGISLFDVPAAPADRQRLHPALRWLWRWLSFHQPVTVALRFEKERLQTAGSRLLSERDTRPLASGIMLSSEVCHLGPLPLACVDGYLFVRGRASRKLTGCYRSGATLLEADIRTTLGTLRRASSLHAHNAGKVAA